jgi:hypothetical protein
MPLRPVIILATAAAARVAGPNAKEAPVAQCDVALQVTKDLTSRDYGKPVVFGVGDPTFVHVDPAVLTSGWKADVSPPPTDLAAQFVSGIRNSVPRCSSVRKWLADHRIRFGKGAVKAIVAGAVDEEYPAGIFTVSLPIISADGQTSLVYTDDVWGEEGGGGFVRLYRRQADGTWKSAAIQRLWIS